jgi:flagellar operon protein
VSVELNPALLGDGPAPIPRSSMPQAPTPLGGPRTGGRAPNTERAADTGSSPGPSFADVLKEATSETEKAGASRPHAGRPGASATGAHPPVGGTQIHFSKHALERVQRRGIALDPTTLGRLREGVGRAAGKGSRDSIVLVDGTAFVVSVGNRTVITAVGSEHMREHVFTNIDSAVIA